MARVPKAMVSLRKLATRWWRRNITRSFIRHMREGMEARLQSAREKGETTFLDLPRDARDGDVECIAMACPGTPPDESCHIVMHIHDSTMIQQPQNTFQMLPPTCEPK